MKKRIIEITPSVSPNIFRIGKRTFYLKEEKIGKDKHIKKLIFEEVNRQEYIKEISELTKKILATGKLDEQAILEQALLHLSKKEIEKVKEKLDLLKKPKLKRGCLNLEIDGIEVPIFRRASFND